MHISVYHQILVKTWLTDKMSLFRTTNICQNKEGNIGFPKCAHLARLAQSVEHETLNLGVVGSSTTLDGSFVTVIHIIWWR